MPEASLKLSIEDHAFLAAMRVTDEEPGPMVSSFQVEVEREMSRMLRKDLTAAVDDCRRMCRSRNCWMSWALGLGALLMVIGWSLARR